MLSRFVVLRQFIGWEKALDVGLTFKCASLPEFMFSVARSALVKLRSGRVKRLR
jgi:hypothetical protein